MQKNESTTKSAKDIVMEYFQAAFRTDFQSARGYLSDNISYVSPLNSFDRAEPYLKYLEHLNRTRLLVKFDIKKVFADSNDVCILHEWNSQTVCVWCHVGNDGKISSIRVIFDPRPFVQQKK
jgi:ketosteroid isomerase-like protein